MLVDDEADIREIATMALETVGGLAVDACRSGQQALDRIDAFAPDVVLLDVMMPSMDGPTTLRDLRQTGAGRDVPVIFLTAKVNPDEVARLKAAGAIEVLAKPFDPMTLVDEVTSLYRSAMADRTASRSAQLDEKLSGLRERFRQRLAGERETIATLVAALREQPDDAATASDLREHAHRVAGTATTVGLEALGAAAVRLQTALDAGEGEAACVVAEVFLSEVAKAVDRA